MKGSYVACYKGQKQDTIGYIFVFQMWSKFPVASPQTTQNAGLLIGCIINLFLSFICKYYLSLDIKKTKKNINFIKLILQEVVSVRVNSYELLKTETKNSFKQRFLNIDLVLIAIQVNRSFLLLSYWIKSRVFVTVILIVFTCKFYNYSF